MSEQLVVPGQRLLQAKAGIDAGEGVYERNGWLYASLSGKVGQFVDTSADPQPKTVLKVVNPRRSNSASFPYVGAEVLGIISRVTIRYAGLEILMVSGLPVQGAAHKATIRHQDIFPIAQSSTFAVQDCFRPGDLVKAMVISLGDSSTGVLLSTARDDLGVALAKSMTAGVPMTVVSYREMACPVSLIHEPRKCIKPINTS